MTVLYPNEIIFPNLKLATYEGEPYERLLVIIRKASADILAIPSNFNITTINPSYSPFNTTDSTVFISSVHDRDLFYPLEVMKGMIYEKVSWYQTILENWKILPNRDKLVIRIPLHLKIVKKEGVQEHSYLCSDRVRLPYRVVCDLEGRALINECCVFMVTVTDDHEEFEVLYNSTTKTVLDGKNYFK